MAGVGEGLAPLKVFFGWLGSASVGRGQQQPSKHNHRVVQFTVPYKVVQVVRVVGAG